jgi:hypothetical protein
MEKILEAINPVICVQLRIDCSLNIHYFLFARRVSTNAFISELLKLRQLILCGWTAPSKILYHLWCRHQHVQCCRDAVGTLQTPILPSFSHRGKKCWYELHDGLSEKMRSVESSVKILMSQLTLLLSNSLTWTAWDWRSNHICHGVAPRQCVWNRPRLSTLTREVDSYRSALYWLDTHFQSFFSRMKRSALLHP